jgi:hypothetical protein
MAVYKYGFICAYRTKDGKPIRSELEFLLFEIGELTKNMENTRSEGQ